MAAASKVRPVQVSMFPDLAPDKPTGKILPSVFVGTNADLMAAVAPYYLTGSVLDVTYGEGKWWDRFKPRDFSAHDKYKLDGVDFTALPESDNSFDTVCFDPPYVTSGGVTTREAFQHAYGIGDRREVNSRTSEGYRQFEEWLSAGVREAIRVSRQWVLIKCMEFSQGPSVALPFRFHDIPHVVTCAALDAGAVKHDQIVHHSGSGPGGHNIFDPKRARRHHSYLLVFSKRGKP